MTSTDPATAWRRRSMALTAGLLTLFAVAAIVAAIALRLPLAGVSALLLAVSATLLGWLSTWAPGPAPGSATPSVRLRALLTVAGALACFLGAAVVARLLA